MTIDRDPSSADEKTTAVRMARMDSENPGGTSLERSGVSPSMSFEDTAGTLGEESGSRVAEARFTNFHPRTQARWADGTVSREVVRDGELVTVTYDGSLTLSGNANGGNGNGNAQQLAISFVDLKIVRNAEEGPDLQGQLVVNGQTIDAATAPAQVRAVLLGLLRFFRV